MKFSKMTLGACLALGLTGALSVQADTLDETRAQVNQNVVGIMAGSLGGSDLSLAADMGLALSDGYDLRVVPMVGLGSVKDVEDLLFLRGIDMAIVQQDVIDFMASNEIFPNIKSAIRLLAPLNVDQFHVLASKNVESIYDLAGQQVNYGPTDGGTFMTSSVVFETLGIDVEITTYPHQVALDKLRNGEIAAMMRASGKPVSVIEEVKPGEPLHLLSVPSDSLRGIYGPTTLTSSDYPALIEPSVAVETVSVANALISYNWPKGHPRGQSLQRFANALFGNYNTFLEGGYHESWAEIDLSLDVPGVPRHWSAEEALSSLTQ
ncbi:MAG: TAXI family TRAP transporter solute-binding subunit [Geminicoccaceae bacterium]